MTTFPHTINGLLLINKPTDWTSHDVVAYVRGVTRIKQIGHTGTLDPFATGLLILLIGNATKQAAEFHKFNKTYEAVIRLGVETDTYDRTGKHIETPRHPDTQTPTRSQVEKVLLDFVGSIKQTPPPFSAKKINGQKAYELARRGHIVKLKTVEINIEELIIRNYEYPYLKLSVTCSTGTYIRSLAYDIGKRLNCGATLWELQRTTIGPYSVKEAVDPKQLKHQDWMKHLIKIASPRPS